MGVVMGGPFPQAEATQSHVPANPSIEETLRVFTRIGCLSFGGPAGQIALMHDEIVERRGWVSETDFLQALNFCHLLPGPEAQQLATWIGWKLHGLKGGLAAGLLFVLPGAAIMLVLSVLYVLAAGLDWFEGALLGLKAAVLVIVAQAVIRIAGRALGTGFKWFMAVAGFLALALFAVPFPIVVAGAGVTGMVIARLRPEWLALMPNQPPGPDRVTTLTSTLRTFALWLTIWGAPLVVVVAWLGPDHVLVETGLFFAKLAVVTFGGAYAVLAYMAQEAVTIYGWLSAPEMADGLGLAETTPGPLILVTQHIGFLAAYRAPEPLSPMIAGITGAALTTWMTFAPCFLWIFAMAPWMARLQQVDWLRGGLAALTATIVGVIASLGLWFGLHILFSSMDIVQFAGVEVQLPRWSSFDTTAAGLTALAAFLIFGMRWSVLITLGVMVLAGLGTQILAT